MNELEKFQLRSIQEIKDQAELLKDLVSTITSSDFDIYIIGSVLDTKRFNEESDVDLAIIVKAGKKMKHKITRLLQKVPFEFGILDVSIFDSESDIKGRKIKL